MAEHSAIHSRQLEPGDFERATGPRRDLTGDDFGCPWCGADCWPVYDDNPITTCPSCGKEFLCPDENADLVCVGLAPRPEKPHG